ncbi:Lipopolysaccharide biosynthesis protein [Aminobacter sp. J15]|nr:Lipopolysaccharide biosynthesis protein [Aminobacter sp. J15]
MVPHRLVEPDSWAGHIPFAFWIAANFRPRRYVELGVHTGNSFCAVAQAVKHYGLPTDCFGIDHWFGDEQAGLYGEDVYADIKAWHDPRYGHFSRLLRMSFEDGRGAVDDGTVDLLHIDGLHTYEAVRTDFETWRSKVSDRGIVLFHDTNVFRADFGVWQYWKEIQAQFPTFEFFHSNGLGVAYVGSQPLDALPEPVAALFAGNAKDASLAEVRGYFARLGEGFIHQLRLSQIRRHGEHVARELARVNGDVHAVVEDRERLLERAKKWDQLAVMTGASLGLSLEELSVALLNLYKSANPQAYQDREFLQRRLAELIGRGTINRSVGDLLLENAEKLTDRVARRLRPRPKTGDDAAVEAIRASGLFDEAFYALNGEARTAGIDPLLHYLTVGEDRRVAPSSGFDPDYYARRHPDVAASGYGLLKHYVLFGHHENRSPLPPARRLNIPSIAEGRPRALLLLEDAERRDPVVLALAIAPKLRETHEVIAVFKDGGALRSAFDGSSTATIDLPAEEAIQIQDQADLVARLARDLNPSFAIVIDEGVRELTRGLAAAGVGVTQLVPGFAKLLAQPEQAHEFLWWPHRVIFPSKVVAQSHLREHPHLLDRRCDILPLAGSITADPEAPFGSELYKDALLKRLRPAEAGGAFLVIGHGPLSAKSGADLFLAVATAAHSAAPAGKPIRFVWINEGGAADEFENRAMLEELSAQRGLGSSFEILDSVERLEDAIQGADLFALTARLCELPNAAATAMALGVPVVCFDQMNSLAESLSAEPFKLLTVPYLDTSAMAEKICRLANDEATYGSIKNALAALATTYDGRLDSYVAKLVEISKEAAEEARFIRATYDATRQADLIQREELLPATPPHDPVPQDHLHAYLQRWRIAASAGVMPPKWIRRPMTGFNPLIYLEDVLAGDLSKEPFTDWLQNGRPEGRWTHPVVQLAADTVAPTSTAKILLHGHFYYLDLVEEFLQRLAKNRSSFDLLLTVPNQLAAETAKAMVKRVAPDQKVEIRAVGNLGRDLGPLLSTIRFDELTEYDILGHIHGKKSPHASHSTGDVWRTFLWEHLVGGETAAADICVDRLMSDPNLGLIFPEDPNLVGWDANFEAATTLAKKMRRAAPLPAAFEWPVGAMFWARPAALKPLYDLNLSNDDYPAEPIPADGTILHALERLIPFAVEQAGFGYAASHLRQVQR